MTSPIENVWQKFRRPGPRQAETARLAPTGPKPHPTKDVELELVPEDPLVAYLQSVPNPVEVQKLDPDSPALRSLQAAGVRLIVPLVSHGELIGLLNLRPRLSDQDYSADDRGLLNNCSAFCFDVPVRPSFGWRHRAEEIAAKLTQDAHSHVRNSLPKNVTHTLWSIG